MRVVWHDYRGGGEVAVHNSNAEWVLTPYNVSPCWCRDGPGHMNGECTGYGYWFHHVDGDRTMLCKLRRPVEQTSDAIAMVHADLVQRNLQLHGVVVHDIACAFPPVVVQLGDCIRHLVLRNVQLERFPVAACRALASKLYRLDVSHNPALRQLPHEMGELRALRYLDVDALPRYPPGLQRIHKRLEVVLWSYRDRSGRRSGTRVIGTRVIVDPWPVLGICAGAPTAAAYALLAVWRKRHKRRGVPVYLVRDAARMVLHSGGGATVWGRVFGWVGT